MVFTLDDVHLTCCNCNRSTAIVHLHLGGLGIDLCHNCLKELGEKATSYAEQVGNPSTSMKQTLSLICQELSEKNLKVQATGAENDFLKRLLKDVYLEAHSEFTSETKEAVEKVIGFIV